MTTTSISTDGRLVCNLLFADNIDLMGSSNGELQDLTNSLTDRAITYGIEVNTKKSKITTNSMNNISADISMNGQKLVEVTSFKYLGATLCKDGTCLAEGSIRIASVMTAIARLNRLLQCNTISFASTFKLYKTLVTSILFFGCETWTLLANSEKKGSRFQNQVREETSLYLILGAQDQRLVQSKINFLVAPQELLLATVKSQTLALFGHVTCHDSLSKTICHGTWEGGQYQSAEE